MSRTPCYAIVKKHPKDAPLVIRDLGPWQEYPTVTNGIEDVIADLQKLGYLPPGRRLLYFDSEGELTEAVITTDGRFGGYLHVKLDEATKTSTGEPAP